MIETPCPTCDGWCCRAVSGTPVNHNGVRNVKHVCPDCEAGLTGDAYTDPAPNPVRTAEDERADVLAFLQHASKFPNPTLPMNRYIELLCDLIEHGEHVGWARKETP